MKTKIGLIGLMGFAAYGQWRMVNGQLYRADNPSVWTFFPALEVEDLYPDGSLGVTEISSAANIYASPGLKNGLSISQTSQRTVYGRSFILRHYHSYMALAPGMEIDNVSAMCVPIEMTSEAGPTRTINTTYSGTYGNGAINTTISEEEHFSTMAYDVGVAYYVPPPELTPEEMAAKKMAAESNVVMFVKEQATNGEADYQCELGERYLKGNGLAQDSVAGREWLIKAESGGSLQASNDLQQLSLSNNIAGK